MDPQCSDITIALYRQELPGGTVGVVHSYSSRPDAAERVAFVAAAMRTLGDLATLGDDPGTVAFRCGSWHAALARRLFLEAVKVDQTASVSVRPLTLVDRKTGQTIIVEHLGTARYRVSSAAVDDAPSRAPAVTRGLRKLAELPVSDDDTLVEFACGHDHDALVGLLLPRAVNVRDALREEELSAGRGVLAAPGAS
jgi:hypothetical protein